MGTRIFVGNLSFDTSEADLRAHFERGGFTPEKVSVVTDRDTGRARGFAFVEMAKAEDASSAISSLDGQELEGRALRVSEANERPARTGGGGGGGGGRRDGGGGGFGGKRNYR